MGQLGFFDVRRRYESLDAINQAISKGTFMRRI